MPKNSNQDPFAAPADFLSDEVEMDQAETITMQSPDGESSTVSRKAFETVYAGRGFTTGKTTNKKGGAKGGDAGAAGE